SGHEATTLRSLRSFMDASDGQSASRSALRHSFVPANGGLGGSGGMGLMLHCFRIVIWLSQNASSNSVSGRRTNGILFVHGFTYAFGSSIVTVSSMWPKSVRLNRSVTCKASLFGQACSALSQPRSWNPVLSTTNVSPSHLPTEYPNHVGSLSLAFGRGRPSVNTWQNIMPT